MIQHNKCATPTEGRSVTLAPELRISASRRSQWVKFASTGGAVSRTTSAINGKISGNSNERSPSLPESLVTQSDPLAARV